MIHAKKSILINVIYLSLAVGMTMGEEPAFVREYKTQVQALSAADTKITDDDDVIGLTMAVAAVEPSGASIIPLAKLWKLGQMQTVELAWWKQTDRAARVWILSLFYTQIRMDVSGAPDFKLALNR